MNKGNFIKDEVWYLASPHGHQDKDMKLVRYQAAALYTGVLMRTHRCGIFSPIAHSHPIDIWNQNLGFTHQDWMDFDFMMQRKCKGLFVLCLPGWEESKGVTMEREYARTLGQEEILIPWSDIAIDLPTHWISRLIAWR